MSKHFPALRFHGDKEAGFRHVKRGMLELFRTQELVKQMGVPIYSRTVEVSEYTTIRVDIVKDQEIVHIFSNPPSLPEAIYPIIDEEKELYRCPTAFIIRSYDGAPHQTDGYLIGYNHQEKRWVRMYFYDELGTVPTAGNIGWYHVPNDTENRTYTQCDIITWKGNCPPELTPSNTRFGIKNESNKQVREWRSEHFWFQGRRFSVSSIYNVLGVCMLEAPDENGQYTNYFYVHAVSESQDTLDPNTIQHVKISQDIGFRQKVSKVLASDGSSTAIEWEEVGRITPVSDIPLSFHPLYNFVMGNHESIHIDKDGFSHVVREYILEDPLPNALNDAVRGAKFYVKINLRDMTWELLNSTEHNSPTISVSSGADSGYSFSSNSLYQPQGILFDSTPATWNGSITITSPIEPVIFYIFPGTEDLYYLALSHQYFASGTFSQDTVTSNRFYAGGNEGRAEIILYKNGDEVRRMLLASMRSQTSRSFSSGAGGSTNDFSSTCEYKSRWIYHFHPETDIENYVEYDITYDFNNGGLFQLTNNHDGGRTLFWSEAVTPYRNDDPDYGPYFQWWVRPEIVDEFLVNYGPNPVIYTPAGCFTDQNFQFENEHSFYQHSSRVWPIHHSTMQPGAIGDLATFKFGSDETDNWSNDNMPYMEYGGENAFILNIDNSLADMKLARTFGIHRKVEGKKPYLWLRRPRYRSSSFVLADLYWNFGKTAMSDDDPGLANANPYYNLPATLTGRSDWLFWSLPPGWLNDESIDPDREEVHWNDKDWDLKSNFITLEQLNSMTDEEGANLFDIGMI